MSGRARGKSIEIRKVVDLLSLPMFWARARVLQISIPRNLFETCSYRYYVPDPAYSIQNESMHHCGEFTKEICFRTEDYDTWQNFLMTIKNKVIYLSANSMGVSPGFRFWGSKYHTSQTTAQDVMSCSRCIVKDCLHKRHVRHFTDITKSMPMSWYLKHMIKLDTRIFSPN